MLISSLLQQPVPLPLLHSQKIDWLPVERPGVLVEHVLHGAQGAVTPPEVHTTLECATIFTAARPVRRPTFLMLVMNL